MFRRLVALATLAIAVPVMAYAGTWSLNTWVKSSGGAITINGVSQTVSNGSVFKTYTTGSTPAVAFTVPAGYTADYSYTDNTGSLQTVAAAAAGATFSQTYTNASATNASSLATLYVTFKSVFQQTSVSYTAVGNIAMTPASMKVAVGEIVGYPITFTFTTNPGYVVSSITSSDPAVTVAAIPANTTTFKVVVPKGYVFKAGGLQFTATAANSATISIPNAGAPQTFNSVPASVTLTGSVIGNQTVAFKNWSAVSWPGATQPFTKTANVNPQTFTPVAGTYVFLFRISDTQAALTNVVVNTSAPVIDRVAVGYNCQNCHTANGIAPTNPTIAARYAASVHSGSDHSSCGACHVGADNGGHPGSLNGDSVDPVTLINVSKVSIPTLFGPVAPGAILCSGCHGAIPHSTALNTGVTCGTCHNNANGTGAQAADIAHSVQGLSCVGCHAVAQTNQFSDKTLVSDNNSGVRAIIPEFQKTSHHIFNGPTAAPIDEQCAVCHLEGTVGQYGFGVDGTKHMTDGFTHLRNASDDSDMQWDPANPNHTTMDNFCMGCHSATGAVSPMIQKLQSLIIAANPAGLTDGTLTALQTAVAANKTTPGSQVAVTGKNPFLDLLSNKYDQVTRAAVVNVFDAMAPGNASHHAVRAPKYNTRSTATAVANGKMAAGQSTLFDGGLFVSDYTPLGASVSVGDDSQLHCGDCHTVGQWTNANTKYNKAAIGAHGSVNEYMLRNNLGTDALHDGTTYVCFNCHNDYAGITANQTGPFTTANGYVYTGSNTAATAGGYYAGYNAAGASPKAVHLSNLHAGTNGDWQNTAGLTGNTMGQGTATTYQQSKATTFAANGTVIIDGGRLGGNVVTVAGVRSSKGTSQGNITGISCTNCHNAGLRKGAGGAAFGGIHGGNAAVDGTEVKSGTVGSGAWKADGTVIPYAATDLVNFPAAVQQSAANLLTCTDGNCAPSVLGGQTIAAQAPARFMGGMGNYRYVPPSNDLSNTATANKPVSSVTGTCYTNAATQENAGYSSCNHHASGTSIVRAGGSVGNVARPLSY
jgi:nitrate/TMAO reductase-like tetraheme cytochrome c subunit